LAGRVSTPVENILGLILRTLFRSQPGLDWNWVRKNIKNS